MSSFSPTLAVTACLLLACRPPALQPAGPAEHLPEALAFLKDGATTREEVLLRLGTPNAVLEGGRILAYAFRRSRNGSFLRVARVPDGPGRPASYRAAGGTDSLVLVFSPQGSLLRHSLVVSR